MSRRRTHLSPEPGESVGGIGTPVRRIGVNRPAAWTDRQGCRVARSRRRRLGYVVGGGPGRKAMQQTELVGVALFAALPGFCRKLACARLVAAPAGVGDLARPSVRLPTQVGLCGACAKRRPN